MITSTPKIHKDDKTNTFYSSVNVESGNTKYQIMLVSGKFNYCSIKKVSANPFGSIGKDFNNFDEMTRGYKSGIVKSMILVAEGLLNDSIK